jgi:hypothetical protein
MRTYPRNMVEHKVELRGGSVTVRGVVTGTAVGGLVGEQDGDTERRGVASSAGTIDEGRSGRELTIPLGRSGFTGVVGSGRRSGRGGGRRGQGNARRGGSLALGKGGRVVSRTITSVSLGAVVGDVVRVGAVARDGTLVHRIIGDQQNVLNVVRRQSLGVQVAAGSKDRELGVEPLERGLRASAVLPAECMLALLLGESMSERNNSLTYGR